MYDILELTIHADHLPFFGFLKDNPTAVYSQGEWRRFLYFEPPNAFINPFEYKGIRLAKTDTDGLNMDGWELVRSYPITTAGDDLIEVLEDLEQHRYTKADISIPWVLDIVTTGIYTKRDTAIFVRCLYLYGYSYEKLVDLFSAIVKRMDLAQYFLETANKYYLKKGELSCWKNLIEI